MHLCENLQIDLEEPTFRLLRLFHGKFEHPIQCDLFNGSFDKPETMIPYAAFSYTWGGSEKLAKVKVNNARTQVTSNLYAALRYLRSERTDLILWIDAICINQNNVHEKIHQIQQMGDIYKRAHEVIVWLGESTENTNFAMGIMTRLQIVCLNP